MEDITNNSIKEEKERCLAWLQHAREKGETDMRQVINWIDTDAWPTDIDDDEDD